ncbi:MAG: acetolactate synthase large subunit [Dehalococcoidia bacterium]|nr:acetolactate synthase large subunit [Dehalococcoidia bacterium]MDP6511496.1 acetolactate synthase large subunit [Dehalococcoidia bacterium]
MKAAELLLKCLEAEGVKYLFGLPGEETLGLLDALSRSPIKFVLTRHEAGAAFMAGVTGRLTGKPGVCFSTLGPGATNLLTGVANAHLDRSPLVAITGQASLGKAHKEAHQYIDVVEIFRPVTKWNARIERGEAIPEMVRKAFKEAVMEKPGATHLELPEDVADEGADGEPLQHPPVVYPIPAETAIAQAARLIQEASYPVALAGNGVIRRGAGRRLSEFAHHLGVPVANTFMGMGAMDYRDYLSLLAVGLHDRDWVMCGLEKADVVIAVGYDQVEYGPGLWNGSGDKKIIHIDTTPAEVDESYQPAVEIVAEIGDSLSALSAACPLRQGMPSGPALLREFVLQELEDFSSDDSFPLKPQRIISDLRRGMGYEDILLSDVGAHKVWLARLFPAAKTNTVVISNGLASMGVALPGAIAAKLAFPHRQVVAVVGDGGFMMTAAELETARRLGLGFVVLVWVDSGYGLISWKEMKRYEHDFGTSFTNPDFALLARSMGLPGFRIEAASQLLPALQQAMGMGQPVVIEVPVDYSENLRLTERLGHLTCPM